jgi:putative transposase
MGSKGLRTMKFSADRISTAAKVSAAEVRRVAREAGLKGKPDPQSQSHQLLFGSEIAGAFKKKQQRKAVEKLFITSVAVAGVPSKRPEFPPENGREPGGAMPLTAHSPAGAAADSFLTLPEWQRRETLMRRHILAALQVFAEEKELRHPEAPFVAAYNNGLIAVTPETKARYPKLNAKRLIRWSNSHVPKWGSRRGTGRIESTPDFSETILAMLSQFSFHLKIPLLHQALVAKFPGQMIPSKSTIGTYVRRYRDEHPSTVLASDNPDKWKGRYRIKIGDGRDGVTRLNEVWELDGSPADLLLSDGKRYHVLATIDRLSLRATVLVARSESANATAQLLCRGITKEGTPERIVTDRGSGFVSKHIQRFLEDIEVQLTILPAFHPELKPFVENFLGVLLHQLFPLLPGFIGHSVADRAELRARTSYAANFGASPLKVFKVGLTASELQDKIDKWVEFVYHARLKTVTGERRYIDPRLLAMVAGDAKVRRIGREGVQIAGAHFVPTKETVGSYVSHIGEPILCFPDPSGDLGRFFLFLDTKAGRESLAVVENKGRLGQERGNLALLACEAQNKFVREQRAELRRIRKKIKPEAIADVILDHAAANAPTLESQSNSSRRTFQRRTPALAAVAVALNSTKPSGKITNLFPQEIIERETESDRKYCEYLTLKAKPLHTDNEILRIRVAESSEWFKARQRLGLAS